MRTILTEASDGYNNTVHCEFLEYATNHGLPAMIFYIVAVMGVFFRGLRFRKTLSSIRLICLCCAFAYLVSSAFGVTTFYVTPFLFIFLGMGEVPTESAEQQQIPPKEG